MASETAFSKPKRSGLEESGEERWARWLLSVVDIALAGCIFVVPMLMGGRSGAGHFGLALCAATATSAWWLRQCLLPCQYWRRSAGHLLLVAAIALVVVQLVPLPTSWTSQLSPKAAELLPLWGDDGGAGLAAWQQLSLAPSETRTDLVLLLAYAMVFWVTLQRIRSMEDVERLLRWVAYSAIGMGLFGLLQYVTGNGKFFWVYQHPFAVTDDAAKGAFTNRNHFAQFLALGIGPVIWWVQDGMRRYGTNNDGFVRVKNTRDRAASLGMGLRISGLAIVFLAILMSMSRGGAIAAGVAATVSIVVCYRAGAVRGKFALGLTAVAILLGALLVVGDEDSMGGRLEGMASDAVEQIDRDDARRLIWQTTLAAIPDFGWFGAGAGSFREVYPLYVEYEQDYTMPTHAENGYLQVTLEAGYLGLILVILAILIGGFWAGRGLLRSSSSRMFVAAGSVAAGMFASVVHSGVDFVWYAPGCLVLALILAATACRINQFTHQEERRERDRFLLPRPAAWVAAPAAIAFGCWMVAAQAGPMTAEPYWISYQRLRRAAYWNPPTIEEKVSLFRKDPSVVAAERDAAEQDVKAILWKRERDMVAALAETVRRNPGRAEAQLALAGGYMRLFNLEQEHSVNRMPLSQIRDAVLAAEYTSQAEVTDWLSRGVGEHSKYLILALQHARNAVALSPLQGQGYLYLAELCFLEPEHEAGAWKFVEQALQVRPHDGTVLFHAGREAWLAGRVDQGLDFWMQSFAAGRKYQRQVIDWMAGRTIPSKIDEEIASIIAQFQPDLDMLMYMQQVYSPIVEKEQMTPLFEAITQAAKKQAQMDLQDGKSELASDRLVEAMSAYSKLGQFSQAVACGEQALEYNSCNFDARYQLGFLLADMGQFKKADEHLTWCARAKPGHNKLQRTLTEVKRALLDPNGNDRQRFRIFNPRAMEYMETKLRVPAPSGIPPAVPANPNGLPVPAAGTGPCAGQCQAYPGVEHVNPPVGSRPQIPSSAGYR